MTSSFKIDDLPGKKKSNGKKNVAIAALLLLGLGGAGAGGYFLWPTHAPDPGKMTKEDAVKYIASKKFADLPIAEKESYMDRMRAKSGDNPRQMFENMNDKDRMAMMQNMRPVMEKKMQERMKKFQAMTQAEKEAEIDRMIAEREARRKAGQDRPPAGANGGGPGGPGGNPSGMFENSSASTRAAMAEFGKMMRAREAAKGITHNGPP